MGTWVRIDFRHINRLDAKMSSEFERTNKEFKVRIYQKNISDNYKKSSEQWKKLYEEEHRKVFRINEIYKQWQVYKLNDQQFFTALQKVLEE